jgi:hypothetical protein
MDSKGMADVLVDHIRSIPEGGRPSGPCARLLAGQMILQSRSHAGIVNVLAECQVERDDAQAMLYSPSIFTQCVRVGASFPSREWQVHVALSRMMAPMAENSM